MPAEVIVAPKDRELVSIFDFSQAETVLFNDMSIGIKVEDAAIMLGLVKAEFKNGKEYKTIRMDRINKYSKEYGFDHIWAKNKRDLLATGLHREQGGSLKLTLTNSRLAQNRRRCKYENRSFRI